MIPKKRLKYEKWNGCDNVIIIDLHNGYSVVAIWSQNEQEFSITLHLKENTTDMWDLIDERLSLTSTRGLINVAILKCISDNLENGFFDYYINRYEYYFKCSQLGCNLLDKESKGDK